MGTIWYYFSKFIFRRYSRELLQRFISFVRNGSMRVLVRDNILVFRRFNGCNISSLSFEFDSNLANILFNRFLMVIIKMQEIETEAKVKIFILGLFVSFLVILMLWAFFARIINDFALDLLVGNDILLLIILGLLGISLSASTVVGITLTEDMSRRSVFNASLVSLIFSFVIIIIMSYGFVLVLYPIAFSELVGIDVVLAFPSVIAYFSLYVLNDVFTIYILTIVIYYSLFIAFLESFYEYSPRYDKNDNVLQQLKNMRF